MIRIGTNPIAWSNDDDRTLGSDITLEQCLSEAAAIGFAGIENGHKLPDNANELKQVLDRFGLEFVSAWHSTFLLERSLEDEKNAIQPLLDKLKAKGCSVCIVCEVSGAVLGDNPLPLSRRPVLESGRWPEFCQALENLAAFTLEQGIRLVFHHHMGTVVQTDEEIDRLMANTGPATHLLFDTGHCRSSGGDPEAALARHIERVSHVHFKNVRTEIFSEVVENDLSFTKGVRRGIFTVPGDQEGDIDFRPLVRKLRDHDYKGWIVVEAEQDPDIHEPRQYQTLGYETVKGMLEENLPTD